MVARVACLKLAHEFHSEDEFPETLQQSCILAIGGAMRDLQVAV
jgi:hypothetical protein